jgi:hypothetical protein
MVNLIQIPKSGRMDWQQTLYVNVSRILLIHTSGWCLMALWTPCGSKVSNMREERYGEEKRGDDDDYKI